MANSIPSYRDFNEKGMHFKVLKIENINQYNALEKVHRISQGIYRGIDNSRYKIFTSLQRQIIVNDLNKNFSISKYIRTVREHEILKQYFNYFKIVPSELSVLSYLQHYGAPTPLLDFTTNFQTALYFAIEKFTSSGWISDTSINDYFSIFFIQKKDLELLAIPEVIQGLKEIRTSSRIALSNYEEFNMNFLIDHVDVMFHINTLEVFMLDHREEFIDVYNMYNNIRIIAQQGLFIHNGNPTLPLEENLKDFFKESARYQASALDEIDDPRIIEEAIAYEKRVEQNKELQSRLEKNIIISYEINKNLIPNILANLSINKNSIYPDSEKICWQLFKSSAS